MRVCIVGASGKLGHYMVQHALDRGYEVRPLLACAVARANRFVAASARLYWVETTGACAATSFDESRRRISD